MNSSEFAFILEYFFVVIFLLFFYILKNNKKNTLSFYVLLWFSLSAASSLLFYYFYHPILPALSYPAIQYYIIGLLIIVLPLLQYNENAISEIRTEGYTSFLLGFAKLLGICSILPIFENLIFIFSHKGLSFIQDAHEALNEGENVGNLSFIALKLNNFCAHFTDILGLILVFLLTDFNRNKKYIFWISLAIFGQILSGLGHGGRATVVYSVFSILIAYKIWYPHFDKKQRTKYNRFGFICLTSIVLLFTAMTSAKFEGKESYSNATEDQMIIASNSLYMGEGPIRFAGYAWNLDKTTQGHYLFDFIVRYVDDLHFKNIKELRTWVETHTGLELPMVFYGLPGYAKLDFGKTIGMFFLLAFSFFFRRVCFLSGSVGFHKLFFVCVFFKIIFMFNMFFPYCGSKSLDIIYILALYFILQQKYLESK